MLSCLQRAQFKLPPLSDGSHCLTITVVASVEMSGGNHPGAPFKPTGVNSTDYEARWISTVYFTVDTGKTIDITPPNIPDISIKQNATFYTPDVPLNFTVNENFAQAAYSLDKQDNVTIPGNTTLTGLSTGAHNLTLYVQDNAGNTADSQTNFTVANPVAVEPQPQEHVPTTLAVAVFVAVVLVVLGFLIYFKKRFAGIEESVNRHQDEPA